MQPKQTFVSSTDLELLRQFIGGKARLCVHAPDRALKHRYITPTFGINPGSDDTAAVSDRSTVGHYLQMYDWDACFFSQAGALIGMPDLALDVARNFLSYSTTGGYTPRTVSPGRVWDKGDQCKPFLCQAVLAATSGPVDEALLEGLSAYLRYFVDNRRHHSGLYRWRNVLESGVDNNLALLSPAEAAKDENTEHTSFPDGRLLACDLSGYLFAEFTAMAELAARSQKASLQQEFSSLAAEVASAIDRFLWDEELSLYCNFDPVSRQPVKLRCWTGLVPVITGAAKDARARQALGNNVLSEEHFHRPFGIPSVAASERLYNQAKRGLYGRVLVSNWQGPMWVLPNVLMVRCLQRNGFTEQAREIAARVVSALVRDVKENNTMHENYNAESGEGLFAPGFMSWNVLALELVAVLS